MPQVTICEHDQHCGQCLKCRNEELTDDLVELIEALADLTMRECHDAQTGTLDSMCSGTLESAIELLAAHGVVDITERHGRRVFATLAEQPNKEGEAC